MKRWIKFPFKNKIGLYCIILFVLLGGLAFFMASEGEIGLAVCMLLLGVIGLVGCWFGYHYGIRITPKNYLLICNVSIKKYPVEKVKNINVYFVEDDNENKDGKKRYNVYAEVFIFGKEESDDFYWTDVSSPKGGSVKLNVTEENLIEIIKQLKQDEKITVHIERE